MTRDLNEKLVFDTFNFEYNEDRFKLFIRDLLVDANFNKEQMIQPLPNEYRDFIRSAKRICKYEYIDPEYSSSKVIDVLVVKLKKSSSVERARTAQRNFISRYLNGSRNYQKDAALVAFISEDENGNIAPDWRFSFIQMNYVTKFVETPNGKKRLKTEVELTPAKRFSFLVGTNEDTHTAQQQLKHCLDKSRNNEKITIEDLVQAFDIEKVSKEFFEEYKKLYLKLVEELKRLYNSDVKIFKDFNEHNINIDDFAKKTMGQLVFLYFIQKKGWLGVKADNDWGTGDKKFLRKLFDKAPEYNANYDNFFNDILEQLFYEALASDRGISSWFGLLNCRIPFLNGGLFEPVNGYEWTKTDLTIDNNIFKEIFDTFDLYNFTVKEDEPLEKEVAIDPEMLGKVFENLLPENIRKGNGAFYTPREIVHYMCQESLINYLYNKVNIKQVELSPEEKAEQQSLFKKKKIDQLKLTQDVLVEIIAKEDIEFFIKTGTSTYTNKTRKISVELPESIINNARTLDKALSEIKVCDPAIGSGAFPVGMMNEIVRARAALSEAVGLKDRSMYELKRNAIENSIYGVDIDAGAVDIAKLRFWLSLVVDEEDIKNIKPLPNLDYKIMQGNSLITSYEGIDFDEIVEGYKSGTQLTLNLWEDKCLNLKSELRSKMSQFITTSHYQDKEVLKQRIEDLILELVKETIVSRAKIKTGTINIQEMEEKIRNFSQNKENRNFFPWKLFFADVFDKGGFDVVIGNPPYVKEYTNRDAFNGLKSSPYYQGKMDLWYFFGCKGIDILKNNGIQSFIAPNNWITNAGASIFRNKIIADCKILNFIDFSDYKVFDTAGIQTMVYIISKSKQEESYEVEYSRLNCEKEINLNSIINFLNFNLETNDIKYKTILNRNTLKNHYIEFTKHEFSEVINKIISDKRLYLEDNEIGQGIVAAPDKCFIITDTSLFSEKELEYIKPYYTTVERYMYSKDNRKILYLSDKNFSNKNIKDYPNILKHFEPYKEDLISAKIKYGTPNKPYYYLHRERLEKFFQEGKEKIISVGRTFYPKFCYTKDAFYGSRALFFIQSNRLNLKYLTGLLNSKLVHFWLYYKGKKQGEQLQIDKEPLMNIPIYNANSEESDKLSSIVNSILNLTNSEDYSENIQKQQAVKEYESQIDIMVYKLYDLTYSEVKIIDPEFQMTEEEYNNYNI